MEVRQKRVVCIDIIFVEHHRFFLEFVPTEFISLLLLGLLLAGVWEQRRIDRQRYS